MDLTAFITTIIRYKYFDKQASIQKLSDILRKSSAVWQKFAQMLSYNEALIDPELAVELQKMLTKCPVHDHDISYKIINKSFNYKINKLKLLGSGTIAQTYKAYDNRTNKDIVFKVLHPNVRNEVREARETYLGVRSSYFFPDSFKTPCDIFFDSIVEQTDMKREYNNGKTMKDIFQKTGHNNLFVFPEMLDYSSECVVMSYEKSTPILFENRAKINKDVLIKCCEGIDILSGLNIVHGFMHSDMHFGNYGIRNCNSVEKMRIVIYDFGAVSDVRDMSQELRCNFVVGSTTKNIDVILKCWFDDCPQHIPEVYKLLQTSIDKHNADSNQAYIDNFKTLVKYTLMKKIGYSTSKCKIALMSEKFESVVNIVNDLYNSNPEKLEYKRKYGLKSFLEKYFDYDDVKPLQNIYSISSQ